MKNLVYRTSIIPELFNLNHKYENSSTNCKENRRISSLTNNCLDHL